MKKIPAVCCTVGIFLCGQEDLNLHEIAFTGT